ncbi:hypothetical protein D9M72_649520 [compost metagenome]
MGPQLQCLGHEGLGQLVECPHRQRSILSAGCLIGLVIIGQALFDGLTLGFQQRLLVFKQLLDLDRQIAGRRCRLQTFKDPARVCHPRTAVLEQAFQRA